MFNRRFTLPVAEVCCARRGEPASAHYAVARRARPPGLDRQRAKAAAQRESRPDHRRGADAEAVRVCTHECEPRARAVEFARRHHEGVEQPLDRARANRIVRRAQR